MRVWRRGFSTVGLPAARRVELWETHNAIALIGLDAHSSQLAYRHRTKRAFPADTIRRLSALRGDAWFHCADGAHTLRPGAHPAAGDVVVCDTGRPSRARVQTRSRRAGRQGDRAAMQAVPRLRIPVTASFRGNGVSASTPEP